MADITRAYMPSPSSASCIAREFMSVASMPMWSAATRAMPARARPAPRKMLPPPITTAVCTPICTISWSSPAIRLRTAGSTPYSTAPSSASPDSFTRMREKRGFTGSFIASPAPAGLPLKKTPREAGFFVRDPKTSVGRSLDLCHHLSHEVVLLLLEAGTDFVTLEGHYLRLGALQELLDRLIGILDERLTEQCDFTQRLAQATFDHLGDDLRRLALTLCLFRQNLALLAAHIGRNVGHGAVLRGAGGRGRGRGGGRRGRAARRRRRRAGPGAGHGS